MFLNTKKKKNLLGLSITAALLISSSSVLADPDTAGDSLITLPKHGTAVATDSVDVWFDMVEGALGYKVDLVRTSATADTATLDDDCTAVTPATEPEFEYKLFLPAAGLNCGQESESSKPGDGDVAGNYICKWTTPILANGNYAIAINPIHAGDVVSGTEKRGACDDDTTARTNAAVDFNSASTVADANYQTFAVDVPSIDPDTTGITQAPNTPEPYLPAAGANLDANGTLTFTDSSPEAGKATWYQLWVYDKNNTRVDIDGDNPSYNHWYKLTVDANLTCTENGNAAGDRVCEIKNVGATQAILGAGADDIFTWWVKAYNDQGTSGWSTAPGTFKQQEPLGE